MLRFGVIHIQTLGVSDLSLPTQTTLIHTRKLRLPLPFISLRFCFISQEPFHKLICQATQKFIEPCETKLRKTVARKLSFSYTEKDYRNSNQVGFEVIVLFLLQETSATIRYRHLSFESKLLVFFN